jgi:hypothetical protein
MLGALVLTCGCAAPKDPSAFYGAYTGEVVQVEGGRTFTETTSFTIVAGVEGHDLSITLQPHGATCRYDAVVTSPTGFDVVGSSCVAVSNGSTYDLAGTGTMHGDAVTIHMSGAFNGVSTGTTAEDFVFQGSR